MMGESPGSLRNQIGRSLIAIRENIEQQDEYGVANHARFLIAICAPKIGKKLRAELTVPPADDPELFEKVMVIVERVLVEMTDAKIYAYKEEPPSDARGLALGEDDDALGGLA